MQRGEITERWDVNYWASTRLFNERYATPRYPLEPLAKGIRFIQYGCSDLANVESRGLRMVRMNNLQADGWDFSDVKHVPLGLKEARRYRLKKGDILFNRTNSKELVGKCEVFRERGVWVFASYLIRVRVDENVLLPDFAATFLNTAAGQLQIDRVSRQIIGMTNVNSEELQALVIPVPKPFKQAEFVTAMEKARAERRAKLTEADAVLAGLDGFLLSTLGLTSSLKDERKVFAVSRSAVEHKPISANLYSPALRVFLRALSTSSFSTGRLSDEVALNPAVSLEELDEDSLVSFIPMEAVEDQAAGGVKLRTKRLSEVQKGYTPFAEGDVLWAKITPCMENGKSCIASGLSNGVGFGSTEFHVLRPRSGRVTAAYVHEFISQASLRRVARYAFTGSAGHQRVPENFLADLPFPVPPISVQETIAAEARRRREEARRLRAEAEAGWQAAKRWFEEQLLTPVKP